MGRPLPCRTLILGQTDSFLLARGTNRARDSRTQRSGIFDAVSFFLAPDSLLAKVNYQAGADAKVILVIVGSVVEGGQHVVGLNETHREA